MKKKLLEDQVCELEKDLERQKGIAAGWERQTNDGHKEISKLKKKLEKAEDEIFTWKKVVETMIELHKGMEMF